MNRALAAGIVAAAVLAGGCARDTIDADAYRRFVADRSYFLEPPPAVVEGAPPVAADGAGDVELGEVELAEASTLSDYLAYAALHSPELESAFAAWKAALERVPQVTALPDPRFTYRYYIREIETRSGPQRNAYELAQTFPWLAKLELRGNVAAEEARAARHRFEAARLRLFYRVQAAYAELYYLQKSIRITGQNIELLNQVEAIARQRYTVGAQTHPDVVRAQVEQARLADRLRTLEAMRGPAAARLNAALNRPADAPLPWPTSVPETAADFADEALVAWAADSNPEVEALDREIAARQQGIDLARQDYYPDLTLGLNIIDTGPARGPVRPSGSGEDPVIAMVSMNIPVWWDRIAAGVREARWRHLKAVSDKAARLNTLSADVVTALFEFQDAGRKIGLYRDTLLPKAEQAIEAAQTAYVGGRTGFQDYLDAQRVLLEFQLSLERARADRALRMAQLEMLVGRPLTTPEPAAPAPLAPATPAPATAPVDAAPADAAAP